MHRFHPLHGKTFDIVDIRNDRSVDHVFYRDDKGHLRTMPIAWTSLISADPVVEFGAGRSPFRLSDLLELARLMETLRAAQRVAPSSSSLVDSISGGG